MLYPLNLELDKEGAGLRKKPRMAPPINLPKPLQMPVAPKPTLTPRTVPPLTESEVQSQAGILPHQHRPEVPLLPVTVLTQLQTHCFGMLQNQPKCRSLSNPLENQSALG